MTDDGELGWEALRRYTRARVALRRIGASLSSADVLAFSMAHARARDAVHVPLDVVTLQESLESAGFETLVVHSQARERSEYLRRPDLGRSLDAESRDTLREPAPVSRRLTLVVADGLSAGAVANHAVPVIQSLAGHAMGWTLDKVVIALQARVGLGDEIGELRGAEAVAMCIGERPGLSAPDSLGIYLTYAPRPGRTDAERNCISNVREGGLSYAEAAFRLTYLLNQARLQGVSGVQVKDFSEWAGEMPEIASPQTD